MFAIFIVAIGALGLAVGSFLNVVAYRLPKGEDTINGRSHCDSCGHLLRAHDLVPVVSWLMLRGKCRDCGAKVHWKHPFVELLTCVGFVAIAWNVGFNWQLPAFLVFASGLVALSIVDFESFIIPNKIVYPTGFICLPLLIGASALAHDWHSLRTALVSSVGCWFFLLVIHVAYPNGMGFGDVRLAALIGLVDGWINPGRAIAGIFFGFFLGAIVGTALIAFRLASRKTAIPFGPYLAMGAFIAIFTGLPGWDKMFH